MGLPRHRIVGCRREQVKRRLTSASFLKDRFPGGERLVCESAQLPRDGRNQLVEGCGIPLSPSDE